MVTEAIRAIDILEKDGLDVGIIDMSTLKPLDEEAIIKAAEETGAIVTAENGTIIGGLGEGVAAVLAENMPVPLVRVGVEDEFSQSARLSAPTDELEEFFGLGAQDIAVSVKECMNKRDQLQRKKRNRI
jgi:transketolase